MTDASAPLREVVRNRIGKATAVWASGASLPEVRRSYEELLAYPVTARVEKLAIGEMSAAWIMPATKQSDAAVLFCHGGGFQIGSISSHMSLMSRLAAAAKLPVLGFEYRLAPEHRFPAATEDACQAYRWLLDQDRPPGDIVVAGDSAGAGLALGVALQARDSGLRLPSALVLMSPWIDLTMRGDSYRSRAELDTFSKPEQLRAMVRAYLGRDGDASHSLASPVEADLAGLPPILIHAGDHDITLDDATLLTRRARDRGVAVELRIWEQMFHHFQVFEELPEARQSLEEIGDFVVRHTGGRSR